MSTDFRGPNAPPPHPHAKPIPVTSPTHIPVRGGPFGPVPPFDGAKSPPGTKNTSHVPCKFFKIGQCQAGKACPFSHSTDASMFEQPCKYFSKGNCKFGQKCALLHVLPNGRIVNRPNGTLGGTLQLGGRVDPMPPFHQVSVLGNSLAQQQQQGGGMQPFDHQVPTFMSDIDSPYGLYDVPPLSGSYNDHGDEFSSRAAMSPPTHLSTLDAPLPDSFDSQGVSHFARHGPVAASVPSKFAIDSPPPPSLTMPKRSGAPQTDTLRNLHDSVYPRESSSVSGGGSGAGGGSSAGGNSAAGRSRPETASSPNMPPIDALGPRTLHSFRAGGPSWISASMPRTTNFSDDYWGGKGGGRAEEDCLPDALSHLLSTEERTRRLSNKFDETTSTPISESFTGNRTPADKVGSPSTASPSRFNGIFFGKHPPKSSGGASGDEASAQQQQQNGVLGSSFGHISSMRNHLGTSPGGSGSSAAAAMRSIPHVSSPPRGGGPLSSPPGAASPSANAGMRSPPAQLQRMRRPDTSPGLPPVPSSRFTSNPRSSMDQVLASSSSAAGAGGGAPSSPPTAGIGGRIDEEAEYKGEPTVFGFELEEGGGDASPQQLAQQAGRTQFGFGSIGDGRRSLESPKEGVGEEVKGVQMKK